MTEDTPAYTLFIKQLTEVTEESLADEHFGVNELALKMNISKSQLHRKLHAATNQSASQFIREIRLQKAKTLLQEHPHTVAEVAYKVGFSSPSYFNKCFHDYYGYSPGSLKNHQTNNIDNKTQHTTNKAVKTNNPSKKSLFIVLSVLIVLILTYTSYSYFNGKANKNSIAILPLRNISVDQNSQFLAEGIMNDILMRLLTVEDIEVKSGISAKLFNNPDLTLKEIAKELKVAYLLEGSISKHDDNVKVYIRLIDTKHDRQLWSDSYNSKTDDLLDFISDASVQIANKFGTEMTKEEGDILQKKYTSNIEAYNQYLEGRFYWQLRGEENLRKSINYFQRAIEIDSDYCLPYVGLADAYAILAWFSYDSWEENIPIVKTNIKKALAIDENLAEAYTTMGLVSTWYEHNWVLAESEFNKAININPNYATAHQWYAEYLSIVGEHEKANIHLNRALELAPHTKLFLNVSYKYHRKLGNYNKALVFAEKIFQIDGDVQSLGRKKFNMYFRLNKAQEAVTEYKKLLKNYGEETEAKKLDSIYAESGLDGIMRYRISRALKHHHQQQQQQQQQPKLCYYIAQNYALINENDKAIEYLNLAYKQNDAEILTIKYNIDFKNLREDPRFLDLLDKLNLGTY